MPLPSFESVRAAAGRLRGVAHRTPVVTSRTLDELTGSQAFLKCENLQRMGAFKFRGAYNRIVQLDRPARDTVDVGVNEGAMRERLITFVSEQADLIGYAGCTHSADGQSTGDEVWKDDLVKVLACPNRLRGVADIAGTLVPIVAHLLYRNFIQFPLDHPHPIAAGRPHRRVRRTEYRNHRHTGGSRKMRDA